MNETPTHVAGVSSNKSMLNLTQYELALDQSIISLMLSKLVAEVFRIRKITDLQHGLQPCCNTAAAKATDG